MKGFLTLILLLNLGKSDAKCSSGRLSLFPDNTEIHPNACLMIDGYAMSQKVVESFNYTPVSLQSDSGDQVKLSVVEYNQGGFNINQSILQPEKSLTPGAKYTFKFENPEKLGSLAHTLLPEKHKHHPLTIKSGISTTPSKLLIAPKFIKAETRFYGCGPSSNAIFEFITDSNESSLVKTEVMDMTDGTTQRYFIRTEKDTLFVGHGMCSDAFSYEPNHEYKARFSIMNSCNTQQDNWTEWIRFDNPYEGYE